MTLDFTGMFEKVAAKYSVKGIPAKYVKIPGNLHTGIPGVGKNTSVNPKSLSNQLALARAKRDTVIRYEQSTGRRLLEMEGNTGRKAVSDGLKPPSWIKSTGF
jgi:hypothetical protein